MGFFPRLDFEENVKFPKFYLQRNDYPQGVFNSVIDCKLSSRLSKEGLRLCFV
jgi:hypothetical protein